MPDAAETVEYRDSLDAMYELVVPGVFGVGFGEAR